MGQARVEIIVPLTLRPAERLFGRVRLSGVGQEWTGYRGGRVSGMLVSLRYKVGMNLEGDCRRLWKGFFFIHIELEPDE